MIAGYVEWAEKMTISTVDSVMVIS